MSDIDRQRIINIISNETGANQTLISADNTFESMGLDSLDIVCIAAEIEDQLRVDIPQHVEADWNCLSDVLNSLQGVMA